jgi:hypothetical protein
MSARPARCAPRRPTIPGRGRGSPVRGRGSSLRVRCLWLVHREASPKVRDPSEGSRDHCAKGRRFSPRCRDHLPIGRDHGAPIRCTAMRHRHRAQASRHRRPIAEDPRARCRGSEMKIASRGARCRASDPVHRGRPEGSRSRVEGIRDRFERSRRLERQWPTFATSLPTGWATRAARAADRIGPTAPRPHDPTAAHSAFT